MIEALGIPYPLPARPIGFDERDRLDDVRGGLTLHGTVEWLGGGDSMTVRSDARRFHVRLVGIDAPDWRYQGQRQSPWAELALRRLQALAPVGAAVRLITDRQVFDRYGQLLAYVYRGRRNLNLELVRSGWAVPYPIYPNVSLLSQTASATVEAQAAGQGIFDSRRPLPLLPYEFRHLVDRRPPVKFCGDTRTRRYVPPAEYQRVALAHRVFFLTEADARAFGYTPARSSDSPAIAFAEGEADGRAGLTLALMARRKLRATREAAYPLTR
jgi:endonuclease YncB( thermonuclease family)